MKTKLTLLFLGAALWTGPAAVHASSTETLNKEKSNPSVLADPAQKMVDDVVVQDAMAEFKSLSRVEKKSRLQEAKKMAKNFKAQKANGASESTLLLAILAILLPPLAVALHEDGVNTKFWISLLLTLCFWIPGVIYALIVVL